MHTIVLAVTVNNVQCLKNIFLLRICGLSSPERDHHCVWLDVCISGSNRFDFLSFLLVTSLTALHLALILRSALPTQKAGPKSLKEISIFESTSLKEMSIFESKSSKGMSTVLSSVFTTKKSYFSVINQHCLI
jgi:hypothetical protein